MMNVSVSNKHNTTWKMLCTVFPGTLFLYQKSHSFDFWRNVNNSYENTVLPDFP